MLPLPHKVPSLNLMQILKPAIQNELGVLDAEMKNGSIAFTLNDDPTFESLAELYGIQNKFKE